MNFSFKIDIVKHNKLELYGFLLSIEIPNKKKFFVSEEPKYSNQKAFSQATISLQKYLISNLIPF